MTTRQSLVKVRIISSVEFIDNHFPNRVASGWATLGVTVTFVRHAVVKGVRPNRNTAQRSGDGGIVDKELISHHFELFVSTNSEERSTNTNDRAIGDVGKSFNNKPVSSHFSQPIIIGTIGPVFRIVSVGNGEDSDFMALAMKFLYG